MIMLGVPQEVLYLTVRAVTVNDVPTTGPNAGIATVAEFARH